MPVGMRQTPGEDEAEENMDVLLLAFDAKFGNSAVSNSSMHN